MSTARWVDSHCHLQGLDDLGDVLRRADEAGVEAMVCVGTDLDSSRQAVELAHAHSQVWATVGLHPHDASRLDDEWDGIAALAGDDRVVGVGEAGFDFHYMHSPPEAQEEAFRAQRDLAGEIGKTLVIHTREAWPETFRVLGETTAPDRVVFHCFTGGPEQAGKALALGAWLSFSGIVTFPGAAEVRDAAAGAPLDRVLVETDTPYLTPVPHRGRPNEPAFVAHVGAGLAAIQGISPPAVAEATTHNVGAAFALW